MSTDFKNYVTAGNEMKFSISGGDFCWRLGEERRRREDRGAEGAEGVWCEEGVWKGGCAQFQENFSIFEL